MSKSYILAAKRTPIGSFLGSLKSLNAAQLGAHCIEGVLKEISINSSDIDEVILGNVISAGIGMGVGRQAAIMAGIPYSTPAYTVNMICGSGMKSVMDAVAHITSGQASVVIAAGAESMSNIPFSVSSKVRMGFKFGDIEMKDLLLSDGLTDAFSQNHMGTTAENVAELMKISRAEQDEFALASQKKSYTAIQNGVFNEEILPIEIKTKNSCLLFDKDEYCKGETTYESLSKLRPAFKKMGTVTAGNSSGINDGGSAILIASDGYVKKNNITPIAEIISVAQTGVEPDYMGLGPVSAIEEVLDDANLSIYDIDLLEVNEAFASQSIGVLKSLSDNLGISYQDLYIKTNINGGAIALGHPLGASGNRVIVTLVHQMVRDKSKYGIASLCVGGGMGVAILVKLFDG